MESLVSKIIFFREQTKPSAKIYKVAGEGEKGGSESIATLVQEPEARKNEIKALKRLEALFKRAGAEGKAQKPFSQMYGGLKESIIKVDTGRKKVVLVGKVERLKDVVGEIAALDIKINDYIELLKSARRGIPNLRKRKPCLD